MNKLLFDVREENQMMFGCDHLGELGGDVNMSANAGGLSREIRIMARNITDD
jgi:hypothetical protein